MRSSDTASPLRDAIARRIARWGLTAPALFFLELHRPFAFPMSQLAIFCQPLIGFALGDERADELAQWLAADDSLTQLMAALETGETA